MKNTLKNRFFAWALIAGIVGNLLIIPSTIEAATISSFPDVKTDNPNLPAIEYLKNIGLINGYPDGTFKPDQTINRAEALKIILLARKRLTLADPATLKSIGFPDVKKTDWFYEYVQTAYSLGVVEGYTDGKFKPANEITNAESLKIVLLSLVKNYQNVSPSKDPFVDVKTSDWYAPYSAYALNRQFIEANEEGYYSPQQKISRAEFAELVYRVEFTEEHQQDKYPISQNWAYCNNYQQSYKVKYPPTWTKIVAGDQMIFWKKDTQNSQVSFARVYPNSAVVIIAIDSNPRNLTLQSYLDTLEYGQGSNKQVITLNGLPYASIFVEESGLQDSYFEMPNGQILVIYAQVGDGSSSTKLKEEIRYIIGSVKESGSASGDSSENCLSTTSTTINNTVVNNPVSSKEQLTSELAKKVLLQGQSQSGLELINDEIILETDTIGIGTGPVDYYYSATIDQTVKIDRNSATILAVKSGKTSAF